MSGLFQILAESPPQLLPAREQMAFTLMFHVILVPFGVALPFITVVMNYIGVRKNDAVAYQLARRWSTIMAVQFAIGVVTGTVLSLEFGLLWPGLMGKWGDVFGIGFGIEAWAFFLEAILVSIYLYGWKRMSPRAHLLVGLPIPFVSLLGAFGILSANAWMNTPQGFTLDSAGNPTNVKVGEVLFNPMLGPQFWHMIAAAYMTAGFLVASVYAVGWLRGRRDRYHRLGFLVPFTVAAIITPIQMGLGDALARAVYNKQPAKFAAIELVWETGPDQTEYIYGRLQPDGTVDGGIGIPGFDSFLAGFSRDTVVQGLSEVPEEDRPTLRSANIAHWAFDTMVLIGTGLMMLVLWYGVAWLRWRDMPRSRWFYRAASFAGVASILAVEAGWITAEVGRQPWIVWGHMKVAEAVTNISAGPIWISFAVIVVVYSLIAWAFIALLLRMRIRWRRQDAAIARGEPPEPEPEPTGSAPGAGARRRRARRWCRRQCRRPGRPAGPGGRDADRNGRPVSSADVIALVLLLAMAAYACGGGADYGAGLWDLVAGNQDDGARPRALVDYAMAPVWEANNVWLIFVFVVTWTGFPDVFEAVASTAWIAIVLAALGLVMRGAGFALRKPTLQDFPPAALRPGVRHLLDHHAVLLRRRPRRRRLRAHPRRQPRRRPVDVVVQSDVGDVRRAGGDRVGLRRRGLPHLRCPPFRPRPRGLLPAALGAGRRRGDRGGGGGTGRAAGRRPLHLRRPVQRLGAVLRAGRPGSHAGHDGAGRPGRPPGDPDHGHGRERPPSCWPRGWPNGRTSCPRPSPSMPEPATPTASAGWRSSRSWPSCSSARHWPCSTGWTSATASRPTTTSISVR